LFPPQPAIRVIPKASAAVGKPAVFHNFAFIVFSRFRFIFFLTGFTVHAFHCTEAIRHPTGDVSMKMSAIYANMLRRRDWGKIPLPNEK
jgi:hypothetical protein